MWGEPRSCSCSPTLHGAQFVSAVYNPSVQRQRGSETDPSFVGVNGILLWGGKKEGFGQSFDIPLLRLVQSLHFGGRPHQGWTEPNKLSLKEQLDVVCPCIYTQLLLYTKKPRDRRRLRVGPPPFPRASDAGKGGRKKENCNNRVIITTK